MLARVVPLSEVKTWNLEFGLVLVLSLLTTMKLSQREPDAMGLRWIHEEQHSVVPES